jgi:hypothetical protein
MDSPENTGWNEDSELHPTCGPDWKGIAEACGEIDPIAELQDVSFEEMEKALKVVSGLMAWIYQNGSSNMNGVAIRAIIVCWMTLPHLRPLTLTQIAKSYGLKKQSVGRWMEDPKNGWKAKWPTVKTCHMDFE